MAGPGLENSCSVLPRTSSPVVSVSGLQYKGLQGLGMGSGEIYELDPATPHFDKIGRTFIVHLQVRDDSGLNLFQMHPVIVQQDIQIENAP